MVNFAVVGSNGNMGSAIIAQFQSNYAQYNFIIFKRGDDIAKNHTKFDIMIDFTLPNNTIDNLKICAKFDKGIVIGTTGFSQAQIKTINTYAKQIPIFFSPNMSFGVHICLNLLKQITKSLKDNADIEIIETHHNRKIDAPSGTAIKMAQVIASELNTPLNKIADYQRYGNNAKRKKGSIGFSSIRGGNIVGEHTVSFFMQGEKIEISHFCYDKSSFAQGAIKAAIWLANKPSNLYSMNDLIHS